MSSLPPPKYQMASGLDSGASSTANSSGTSLAVPCVIQEVSSTSLPRFLFPNIEELAKKQTFSYCCTFCRGYCQDSASPNCRYHTGFLHFGVGMAFAFDEKTANLPKPGC